MKNLMKVKIRALLHYTPECLTIKNGMKLGKEKMEEHKETFQDKASCFASICICLVGNVPQ
jgi:CRISPR/Cas system-associated protein Cas10 (large subunit of type III CRISPR-Cas system)